MREDTEDVYPCASHDTTINSARHAQARFVLVDEEEKLWWGLSTGINDDKTINTQRYQQADWIWERM